MSSIPTLFAVSLAVCLASGTSALSQCVPAFDATSQLPCNNWPGAVAVRDLNGDGRPDLVVVNNTNPPTISVLLGGPGGTFAAPATYAVGPAPVRVAIADFNNDGNLDLAVTNSGGNTVSILLGCGDGTFLTPAISAFAGNNPDGIAAGDFDGDGIVDLAVTGYGSGVVSVMLGMGDGTFFNPSPYAAGSNPIDVAVGDFNGDHKLDLAVVCNACCSENLFILNGNGDGSFAGAVGQGANWRYSTCIVVGDFNGDHLPDFAVGSDNSHDVRVLLGMTSMGGAAVFAPAIGYAAPSTPWSIAMGDINGDGHADLITANGNNNTITVMRGNGDGTFLASGGTSTVANNPVGVGVGDFDGDGRLDVVAANSLNAGVVSVLLNNGRQPRILLQPLAEQTCLSGTATFTVSASSAPITALAYQWRRDGMNLVNGSGISGSTLSGVTAPALTITGVSGADAGGYDCVVSNTACGATASTVTNAVSLGVCRADFNCSGTLTVQDIFDYLSAWFAGAAAADFNGVNGITVQDIFDFLNAWFTGC